MPRPAFLAFIPAHHFGASERESPHLHVGALGSLRHSLAESKDREPGGVTVALGLDVGREVAPAPRSEREAAVLELCGDQFELKVTCPRGALIEVPAPSLSTSVPLADVRPPSAIPTHIDRRCPLTFPIDVHMPRRASRTFGHPSSYRFGDVPGPSPAIHTLFRDLLPSARSKFPPNSSA